MTVSPISIRKNSIGSLGIGSQISRQMYDIRPMCSSLIYEAKYLNMIFYQYSIKINQDSRGKYLTERDKQNTLIL